MGDDPIIVSCVGDVFAYAMTATDDAWVRFVRTVEQPDETPTDLLFVEVQS